MEYVYIETGVSLGKIYTYDTRKSNKLMWYREDTVEKSITDLFLIKMCARCEILRGFDVGFCHMMILYIPNLKS